jgi:hypothetical protein
MYRHLCNAGVLLKNFGAYASALSDRVRDAAHAFATRCGRPFREVETELKHRPEGLRLKHYVNGNWIKIYDEHGQVLRVETTLTHPQNFRVYRAPEGYVTGPPDRPSHAAHD